MNSDDLERLIADLRYLKNDHQTVEAKEALDSLPRDIAQTMSAFANGIGGVLLLGVKEGISHDFEITGVNDPSKLQTDLQNESASMEPPLRPAIHVIQSERGAVVVAEFPAIPKEQRPCFKSGTDLGTNSFARSGDSNRRLNRQEVQEMLAVRSSKDHSILGVAEEAELDKAKVAEFLKIVRHSNQSRYAELPDEDLLRHLGVFGPNGKPSLAGTLVLGSNPRLHEPAARLVITRLPKGSDPAGTAPKRLSIDGTIGELLEEGLETVFLELEDGAQTVTRGGHKSMKLDVPKEALREMLSNALVHRSFNEACRNQSVVVEIMDEAVEITNPGILPASANLSLFGVGQIPGVRNNALVLICSMARTPSGNFITDHQSLGITTSDAACRKHGTMPAIFVESTASFKVILLRGVLDIAKAKELLQRAKAPVTEEYVRLVSVAQKLEDIKNIVIDRRIDAVAFDAQLAARSLSSCSLPAATIIMGELEKHGVLRRIDIGAFTTWVLEENYVLAGVEAGVTTAPTSVAASAVSAQTASRRDRVPELICAIGDSEFGRLSPTEIAAALSLSSTSSRNRWIKKAEDEEMVERTTESSFDPNLAYRLTSRGNTRYRSLKARP
jgi:ATP-dependent DNA helicase RecG